MQFCPACDNKLYMQIGQTADVPLTLYCKHCPYTKDLQNTRGDDSASTVGGTDERYAFDPCMCRSNYSSNHPLYYSTVVNEYTFDDPTLPRLTISCQNESCPSHTDPEHHDPEVLFVRYNDQDMKFMYLCKHCRQCWHTNDSGETEVLFDFARADASHPSAGPK